MCPDRAAGSGDEAACGDACRLQLAGTFLRPTIIHDDLSWTHEEISWG
jgi:hypothetical protein